MKKTPWFPANVKPARPGVYEVKSHGGWGWSWYRLWTGTVWMNGFFDPAGAIRRSRRPIEKHRHAPWRGLAEEPK